MRIVNRENGELIFDSMLPGAGTLKIPEGTGVFVMTDQFEDGDDSSADQVVQVHKLDRKTFVQLGHFWGAYFELFVGELKKNDIVEAPVEVRNLCESLRKNSAKANAENRKWMCIGNDAVVNAVLIMLSEMKVKFESAAGGLESVEIGKAIEKVLGLRCSPVFEHRSE